MFAEIPNQVVMLAAAVLMVFVGGGAMLLFLRWMKSQAEGLGRRGGPPDVPTR